MKTNDIKKGMRFQLRDGWYATMADNMRGNTRVATVEGVFTDEMGSVYSHNIMRVEVAGVWVDVEYTVSQLKLKKSVEGLNILC